jgi:hypothetical protein
MVDSTTLHSVELEEEIMEAVRKDLEKQAKEKAEKNKKEKEFKNTLEEFSTKIGEEE